LTQSGAGSNSPRVALFATCLVDIMRPAVGFATAKLLQRAGCDVAVPRQQTCCGQPAYNAGERPMATDLARRFIATFEGYDYVVAPSGSCAAMVKRHYPKLLENDSAWSERARDLAARTYELTEFLVDVMGVDTTMSEFAGTVTYHDACSGLRELGVKSQPRELLQTVPGVALIDADGAEECCGFGGTFCVKHPGISARISEDKTAFIRAAGATTLAAGDLGCLMNLAGKLSRDHKPGNAEITVRHIAEILSGDTDTPGIGAETSSHE